MNLQGRRYIALVLCIVFMAATLPLSSFVHIHLPLDLDAQAASDVGEDVCTCKRKCTGPYLDHDCPVCSSGNAAASAECKGLMSWSEQGGTAADSEENLRNLINLFDTTGVNYGYLKQYYVPLDADITLTSILTVPTNCNIVIDLNGHTLSSENKIQIDGKLTLWDLAGGGTVINNSYCTIVINEGYFLMDGGTITGKSASGICNIVEIRNSNSTFEMRSGTIIGHHDARDALVLPVGTDVDVLVGGTMIISGDAKILCCSDPNCTNTSSKKDVSIRFGTIIANGGVIDATVMSYLDSTITSTSSTTTAFKKPITVYAGSVISAGNFTGNVTTVFEEDSNGVTISGGTFSGTITNYGAITGGTFKGDVINGESSTISGGTFSGVVTNEGGAKICGGTFNGTVVNKLAGFIDGGTFMKSVANEGIIADGVFYGSITGEGIVRDTVNATVSFDLGGASGSLSPITLRKGEKVAEPTLIPQKEGYIFLYWTLNGERYDFDSGVTGDITLTATWWERELAITSQETLIEGTDYTYEAKVLKILTSKPLTISNIDKARPSGDTIVIAGGVSANITLENVNIDVSDTGFVDPEDIESFEVGKAPITIESGDGDVNITVPISTKSILKAGALCAALQKSYYSFNSTGSTGTLTISGGGVLDCTGGIGGAGIGGEDNASTRNITVTGGRIYARGGESASGIGGGFFGDGRNISISGGVVVAIGGTGSGETITGGAGIGGGASGSGKTITVSGGTVSAYGGKSAYGIGGGSSTGQSSEISISSGTVTAVGGEGKSAFGTVPSLGTEVVWQISAGDAEASLSPTETPLDTTYTGNRAVRISDGTLLSDTVSVEITWSAMTFVYHELEWNPDTHSYISEGWTTDGGVLTFRNAGGTDVRITTSFNSKLDSVTGVFDSPSIMLSPSYSGTATLILSGKPENELSGISIGTVTVNVSKITYD